MVEIAAFGFGANTTSQAIASHLVESLKVNAPTGKSQSRLTLTIKPKTNPRPAYEHQNHFEAANVEPSHETRRNEIRDDDRQLIDLRKMVMLPGQHLTDHMLTFGDRTNVDNALVTGRYPVFSILVINRRMRKVYTLELLSVPELIYAVVNMGSMVPLSNATASKSVTEPSLATQDFK